MGDRQRFSDAYDPDQYPDDRDRPPRRREPVWNGDPQTAPEPPPEPSTPTECMAQGICPACWGRGFAIACVPPPDHQVPCPLCEGDGEWPPSSWGERG